MTTSDFSPSGIRVSLHNVDLWQKFYPKNEMIATKSGRKLFPDLDVNIEGLLPDELYTVSLYLERVDNIKYKFSTLTGQWEEAGFGNRILPIDKKLHKDGGMVGAHWIGAPVSFSNIHITNVPDQEKNDLIFVSSMHKYRPVITVKRLSDRKEEEFRLTMTEFMAVTVYQDREIVELKKASNKYSSRFTGAAKRPRGKKRAIVSGTSIGSTVSPQAKKTSMGPMYYQHQTPSTMITPPSVSLASAAPPSATPPAMAMTPNAMTPTMANPPVQNRLTAWDPMYSQNQMMTPPAMTPSMTPYPMTQQTMTPPTMQTPPSMFPTPMTPSTMTPPTMGTNNFQNQMTMTTPPFQGSMYNQNPTATLPSLAMTPQNMAPPSTATHDYTMNQYWNSYGTWNMHQKSGGAAMPSQQPQWNTMNESGLGYPGNMQQNNYGFPQYPNYNGAGTSSQQGSSDADFDFQF